MGDIKGQAAKHGQFFRNAAWQYGLQFVKHLLPLITLPYLTRVLEPEGYAVYAYVVAFMQFMQILVDFGFNLSGTKRIADARSVEERNLAFGEVTQARLLLCGVGALIVFGATCVIPIMHEYALYSMLAYVAVCGRGLAPDFLFQGMERMGPITTRYFVSKGTSTAFTFVFVRSFADILWIPVLDILASAIALAWSLVAARRLFGVRPAFGPMRDALRELGTSGLYCLSNMASSAFSGFSTIIIGLAITNSAEVSYWSLAVTGITAVQTLFTPITSALYPRMVVSGDWGFANKLAKIALPVLVAGTAAYVLLSDWIVLVLGGSDYLPGSYVLRATSPVLVISYYSMLFGWPVLGAAGKIKEITSTTIISGAFSVIAMLALWASGCISLLLVAVVRVLTELLLMVLRMAFCRKAGLIGRKAAA